MADSSSQTLQRILKQEPGFPSEPADPRYVSLSREEARFWSSTPFDVGAAERLLPPSLRAYFNEAYTGRGDLRWLDDVVARGPFERVAFLGSTGGYYEVQWFEAGGTGELDIYELSTDVIDKAQSALSAVGHAHDVQFIQTDLNFATFPRDRYDMIVAVSTLHHLIRLEHVFPQVHAALRDNGMFAFNEYVGERCVQFSTRRLAAARVVFDGMPARYRRPTKEAIGNVPFGNLSPFEALRSDDILPLARRFFETVSIRETGVLLVCLGFHLDLLALEDQEPALIPVLIDAEQRARSELAGTLAYALFRRRTNGGV